MAYVYIQKMYTWWVSWEFFLCACFPYSDNKCAYLCGPNEQICITRNKFAYTLMYMTM